MSNLFVPIEPARLEWRDGLPFSTLFDDIYFSTENGLKETEHVFIQGNRLLERWQNLNRSSFVIAETGFGSGLNFLLAWSYWLKHAPADARLHFISCEQFPLTKADLSQCLSLWPQLKEQAQALLKDYPILTPGFHHLSFEEGRVNLTLMLGEATLCFHELLHCGDALLESELSTTAVDAWFLDGFSPAKNESMWSENLLYNISLLSRKGTTIATFSAAALVKKNLQNMGFKINKVKGFGRKRDMLVGDFESIPLTFKSQMRTTPWHCSSPQTYSNKRAIVIGAGFAGCHVANALAKRHWQVTLIEQNTVASGASANKQAVLYPKLSSFRSPLTQFMLTSFLYAVRNYKKILEKHDFGDLSGILQLAFDDKEKLTQANLDSWLNYYPELGRLVSAEQGVELAGVPIEQDGLFIPFSGWLNSQALCQLLSRQKGIDLVTSTSINELDFVDNLWHVNEYSAEVVVIANGYRAGQFSQTNYLPLKSIRGQMTELEMNEHSKNLKIPLCGDGHVLPAINGIHSVGATYQLGATTSDCSAADDIENLMRLKHLTSNVPWSSECKKNWAGIRGATTDYMPVVGPVAKELEFYERFATLSSNAKRWLAMPGIYYPGLYVCAGFGSRGVTTVPLCAEWLASSINNEPFFLPRSLVQSLSSARFLRKTIIRKV